MRIRREVARKGGVITYEEFDDEDPDKITTRYDEDAPPPPPLDQHAQTLVLLTVKGYITEDEAAAITGRSKADLAAGGAVIVADAVAEPTPPPARLFGFTQSRVPSRASRTTAGAAGGWAAGAEIAADGVSTRGLLGLRVKGRGKRIVPRLTSTTSRPVEQVTFDFVKQEVASTPTPPSTSTPPPAPSAFFDLSTILTAIFLAIILIATLLYVLIG